MSFGICDTETQINCIFKKTSKIRRVMRMKDYFDRWKDRENMQIPEREKE